MKKNQSLWIWKGLVPHCLRGQELALALLLREKPLTAAQLCAALTDKGMKADRKSLSKTLAALERLEVVSVENSAYLCTNKKLVEYTANYTEDQLLDLVGMTQNTLHGQSFFSGTGTPPMSVSSRGSSGM